MNLQELMKQAQSMQKTILKQKSEIENEEFEGTSELVTIKMNGKKEVTSVKIKKSDDFNVDDLEMLEDMIMIAVNDALSKINAEISKKMGSQAGQFSDLM